MKIKNLYSNSAQYLSIEPLAKYLFLNSKELELC